MSTNYYRKAQAMSLLNAKADLVGVHDIEITDSDKGFILKASGGERIRVQGVKDGTVVTHKETEVV